MIRNTAYTYLARVIKNCSLAATNQSQFNDGNIWFDDVCIETKKRTWVRRIDRRKGYKTSRVGVNQRRPKKDENNGTTDCGAARRVSNINEIRLRELRIVETMCALPRMSDWRNRSLHVNYVRVD